MERTICEPDHELFRNSFRAFVAKEITPRFLEWEANGIVHRELFTQVGASGFLCMEAPEALGGGGVSSACSSRRVWVRPSWSGMW